MKKNNKYYELLKYLIVGIITTAINIAVFYLFDTILNFHYLIANFISIAVSIVFAFFMNKKYVFEKKRATVKEAWNEFILFVSFRAISGVVDMATMGVFVSLLNLNENSAKLITQFIIVSMNYIFSKFYIFKKDI